MTKRANHTCRIYRSPTIGLCKTSDSMATHPNAHFHFTPTYSSWLNQVEIWFSKVERDVIARGIFTSVKDLARTHRRYINAYSANDKSIQWKYSDPTRRIRSNPGLCDMPLAALKLSSSCVT